MKFFKALFVVCYLLVLTGCNESVFDAIDEHQSFLASVNILEPSITFYDEDFALIATWDLDNTYTGATLVGTNAILLYGHQLDEAELYDLSSGKQIVKLKTGIGTTNALYDEQAHAIYLTNSKTNELTSYSVTGELQQSLKLRNYPMSMALHENMLYVVNYKDTFLSVIDTTTFKAIDEWLIESSSQGALIVEETNELWLGGHGQGSKPNEMVQVFDLTTGMVKKEIAVPVMPITLIQQEQEVIIASHGSNMVYSTSLDGTINWQQEVAANPFSVAYFDGRLVVAGYDDQTLYVAEHAHIIETVDTGKGAFQLLVRE
ncbi:YncE family protein [Solibacillus sp. MA9]|uniref:YncE family protein n=1 Tax=Solibacillus palustris TaxID=2908203 RepID=A0ABS9UEY3_9BACL|nr:YncE family protein [Solibacillus sp. MA9]MCH7322828.1 YncE family protein [Solibacillus sp. MA9]